jgi:response regulator RpfG family c-di-GMP phosphodiesterase
VPRPTFIIAEPEPDQALSARKLVLETAKFNVITAHSARELRELLERFPGSDAVVIHEGLPGGDAAAIVGEVKRRLPDTTTVFLSPNPGPRISDYHANSHDPQELLELLRQKFGDPRVGQQ